MRTTSQTWSLAASALLLCGAQSWAVPIGIIDSGTDMDHPDLAGRTWTNPGGLAGDTYKDDTHGWNFAESNNQVIDLSYLGKFSPDVAKFFEIQLKVIKGTVTPEEKAWMDGKRKDQTFVAELMKFGNFVHGTHVAGIASEGAEHAQVMAAKIIPTEVKMPGLPHLLSLLSLNPLADPPGGGFGDGLIEMMLGFLIDQQLVMLKTVGQYMSVTQMKAANCSFGTSMVQAKTVVGSIGKMFMGRDLTEAESEKYAKYFMAQMIEKGAELVKVSPKTLFVMAAGNDGTNNDEAGAYPANLKFDNTLTVAATRGYSSLASFSNYGEGHVDIAAPGVGIVSAIPGKEHLALSGTSQATPFITRIVGKIMDANPKLSFSEVKQVLMGTVDKKDFLKGKVKSAGVANEARALRAAELSVQLGAAQAIEQARSEVRDVKVDLQVMGTFGNGFVIPLPALFKI